MMLSTLIFVLTQSQRIVPAQGVKGSFKWAPLENQPTNYKVRALPQKYTSSMPYNPTSCIPNQPPTRQGKSPAHTLNTHREEGAFRLILCRKERTIIR